MFRFLRIKFLKLRARRAYLFMEAVRDSYDCGHSMCLTISRDYGEASVRYEDAMARLREIDPSFPKGKSDD